MKLTDAEFRYLRAYWHESLTLVRGPAKRNMPTERSVGYLHGKLCSLLAVFQRTVGPETILKWMEEVEITIHADGPVWPWRTLQDLEDRSAQADAFLEHAREDAPIIREESRAQNADEQPH